jgi:hypothetical protein
MKNAALAAETMWDVEQWKEALEALTQLFVCAKQKMSERV